MQPWRPLRRSFLIGAPALLLRAAPAAWRAGAASVDITPAKPLWMAGFGARTKPSEGVLQPLHAKALAIEDQNRRRFVLITADLLGFTARFSDAVAARIQAKHGIPRERIVFNASHTHGGPVIDRMLEAGYAMNGAQWADVAAYTRDVERKVAVVIDGAIAALQPARLSLGYTEAPFAYNYRTLTPKGWVHQPNLAGPVDRTVPVLRVDGASGKPIAMAFGYACHPTVIAGGYLFSGDYAGFAQSYVEERFPDAVAMFVQGFGGDAKVHPRGSVELARAHGATLGRIVEAAAVRGLDELRGPLAAAYGTVRLPFAPLPSRAEFERRAREEKGTKQRHAQIMLARLDAGATLPVDLAYPVQVWRFGNSMTLLAMGGEILVDYALRFRQEFAGMKLWLAGYSNDVSGYIPSERVLREGGYEGGEALLFYTQPGIFAAGIEELVAGKTAELVKRAE